MHKRKISIFTAVAFCLLCVVTSCSKSRYNPGIDKKGAPTNYYVSTESSATYANIQEVVEYLAESNVGDDTGITRAILQMLYSGEISAIAARNYIDVGVMGDWSEKLRFERYSFTYRTKDAMGRPTNMSGTVIFPRNIENSYRNYELDNVTLYNGSLIETNEECASVSGASTAMLRILFNSMVVIPDYQGYGASYGMYHPYFESKALARQAIDCELAAIELAAQRSVGFSKECGTYNIGIGRGGMVALQACKMLETSEPAKIAKLINLKSTYCSSSVYDVNALLKEYAESSSLTNPWMFAMAISSAFRANSYRFSAVTTENMMSDKFNKTFVTYMGKSRNLMDMMEGLCIPLEDLSNLYSANALYTPKGILNLDVYKSFAGTYSDTPACREMRKINEENDPTLGWKPTTPILIEQSDGDDMFGYDGVYASYEKLKFDKSGIPNENVSFNHMYLIDHDLSLTDAGLKILREKDPVSANR